MSAMVNQILVWRRRSKKKEETPSEPQSKLHIEESKIDMNALSGEMKKEFIHIYTRQSWSKSIIIRSQVSIQKR